jgi:hypothetical protein
MRGWISLDAGAPAWTEGSYAVSTLTIDRVPTGATVPALADGVRKLGTVVGRIVNGRVEGRVAPRFR